MQGWVTFGKYWLHIWQHFNVFKRQGWDLKLGYRLTPEGLSVGSLSSTTAKLCTAGSVLQMEDIDMLPRVWIWDLSPHGFEEFLPTSWAKFHEDEFRSRISSIVDFSSYNSWQLREKCPKLHLFHGAPDEQTQVSDITTHWVPEKLWARLSRILCTCACTNSFVFFVEIVLLQGLAFPNP